MSEDQSNTPGMSVDEIIGAIGEYETADGKFIVDPNGRPSRGTFPRSWGRPPDDLEERQRWMIRNIQAGKARLDRGEVVEGQRPKTGRQAMAALKRKRESAAPGNHYRMQLLKLLEKGPQ